MFFVVLRFVWWFRRTVKSQFKNWVIKSQQPQTYDLYLLVRTMETSCSKSVPFERTALSILIFCFLLYQFNKKTANIIPRFFWQRDVVFFTQNVIDASQTRYGESMFIIYVFNASLQHPNENDEAVTVLAHRIWSVAIARDAMLPAKWLINI